MRKFKDLSGEVFNCLTVLKEAPPFRSRNGALRKMWWCRCVCGVEKAVRGSSLKEGTTRSCGCQHEARRLAACTKHGMSKRNWCHPLYAKWESMKARCYSPTHKGYPWYGGKGIVVEEPWKSDFASFYRDMLPTWKEGLSLDRKDPRGNYCLNNCQWVPLKDQWDNTTRTHFVRVGGDVLTLKKAGDKLGINRPKALIRLKLQQVDADEARKEIHAFG